MKNKEWLVEGNVWKVGNNVNTESITPSRILHGTHEFVMEHIGEVLIPGFPQKMKQDDIWAGGTNLGCSSQRNAPRFLKEKGISLVICGSAGRNFYRNAIHSGVPVFEIGNEMEKINMGDRVRVNVKTGEIKNLTTGVVIQAKPFPDFIMEILEAGSIKQKILNQKDKYPLLK